MQRPFPLPGARPTPPQPRARGLARIGVTLGALAALLAAGPGRAAEDPLREQIAVLRRAPRSPFAQEERVGAIRRLGAIGGPEAALALLPILEEPFEHLPDHVVAAWSAMLRGGRAEETRIWLETEALGSRLAVVRAAAARALGEGLHPAAVAALRARVPRERDVEVLIALVAAMGHLGAGGDEALGTLAAHRDGRVVLAVGDATAPGASATLVQALEAARTHRDPLGRAGAVVGLARAGRLGPQHVRAVASDPSAEPRIALAELWGGAPEGTPLAPQEREALERLLGADDSWRVRAAAIGAARARRLPDLVPLLIDRLAVEEGRLRLDLSEALADLTGKELGEDVELWRAWWEVQGTGFRPPARGKGGSPPPPRPGETRTASFFRLPVRSTRVGFLLDCSGSMAKPLHVTQPRGPTKFDLAREELGRTLASLGPESRFDVFLHRYPSVYPPRPEMTRALGGLEPATSRNVDGAQRWLRRQEAAGWGAFSDALEAVLSTEVDTLFFLSDGVPSRGRFARARRLVEEIERANRFRRVAIHTVLVGTSGADRRFMRDLAAATGGRFAQALEAQASPAARGTGRR